MVRDARRRGSDETAPGGEIEAGSRVVVLQGRNFPSFGAGDQGRVIRVDKEALNCEVLFDGGSHPLPVALRHLRLGSAGYNGRAEQPTVEPSRRKSSLSDGSRSRSASPRRTVTIEPVALETEQRLHACEVALDSSAQITPRKTPQRRALAEDDRSSQPLEERLVLIEQRIKNEVEVLAKQLREAISFGQAQESRANALQRHLQSCGIPMPGSGTIPAAPSSMGSGPVYLSAALPPRLCATPTRDRSDRGDRDREHVVTGTAVSPTAATGPCIEELCGSCGTANAPGSKFCIKCGHNQVPLSASASTTASQSSYIRGSSYLASGPAGPGQSGSAQLLQPTAPPAAPHMLMLPHGHPVHPGHPAHPVHPGHPAHMHPGMGQTLPPGTPSQSMEEPCGVPPACLTPPQVLTPRLVLPHRPFG